MELGALGMLESRNIQSHITIHFKLIIQPYNRQTESDSTVHQRLATKLPSLNASTSDYSSICH